MYFVAFKIVSFLKKIEFKENLNHNEIETYTINFKIIKFDLISFQNIYKIYFYQFLIKYGLFIFITALKRTGS